MSTYSHPTIPAGSIVVGVDGSGSAAQALVWAVDQAVRERRPLTVAHAVETSLNPRGDLAVAQRLVDAACDEIAHRAPELEVHRVVSAVDPRSLLIELSEHAEMLVLGSRGRGPVRSLLLGSVGTAVIRHAHCPVVVHRPTNPGVVRRGVLIGVDGAPDSPDVLEHGYRLASQRGLPVTVVHCFSIDEEDEHRVLVAEAMAGLAEKYPDVHVTTRVVRGAPEVALVSSADRMDLVVVGAHHGGLASAIVFRSVSGAVVEHATCPVVVVRH